MYIQFLSPIAGHTYSYAPGDIVNYVGKEHEAEAKRLCERGIADEISEAFATDAIQRTGRVGVKTHRVPAPAAPKPEPKADPLAGGRGKAPARVAVSENDWPG